jgi:PAS domain S-box-containing protein
MSDKKFSPSDSKNLESDIINNICEILKNYRLSKFDTLKVQSHHPQLQKLINELNETTLALKGNSFLEETLGDEGVWEFSPQGQVTYVNDRLAKMLGYNKSEILGQIVFNFMDDEWKILAQQKLKDRQEGKDGLLHCMLRKKDGSPLWVNVSAQVFPDETGGMKSARAMMMDISDIKEQEFHLQKMNDEMNTILDASGLGAWEWFPGSNKTIFDRRWCEILGLKFEEVPPDFKLWEELIHPEDFSIVKSKLQDCLSGEITKFESIHRVKHKNGSWIWVLAHGSRRTEKEISFCGTYLDITRFKEVENLASNIQHIALIGGWELDLLTGKSIWTDETYHIHQIPKGTPTDKLMGIDFYGPHEKERLIQKIHACERGAIFKDTFQFKDALGTLKWVEVMGEPVRNARGVVTKLQGTIQDVTTLVSLSKELNSFFDVSLELLCIAGFDGKFKKINPAFSELLQFSEDELKKNKFIDFIHPDDVQGTLDEMKKLSDGIPTIHFENRYRCKDGSYKILSWASRPDQKSELIYAAARDVTEIRNKEREFTQLINAIDKSAIVAITDEKGRIQSVNDNFCNISGYSEEELIGQDHRIINSGAHSKEFFKSLWTTVLEGKVWSGEIENKAKDGHSYFVQTVITPLTDVEGKIKKMIAIRFDKTKQKESERLLEEAERVAKIGSWSLQSDSQEFIFSKQLFKLFGLSHDQVVLLNDIKTYFFDEDLQLWERSLSECGKDFKKFNIRLRRLMGENSYQWFEVRGEPWFDSKNDFKGSRGTFQDITELVEAEERIKHERAKALQSAKLASLGEMSAGIAHEINNPLAIISGMMWILPSLVNDPEQFGKKIATTNRAIERISKIVGGLKKFSRSYEKSDKKPHLLSDVIKESLNLVGTKSARHSTPLEVKLNSDALISCDEIEIEQVLVNLINNGIDAVKNLEERWIKLELSDSSDEVILRIIDSGFGIPQDVQAKLFQPFFTTKAVGEGTGLGLSIVKGILEDHKATIEVRNDQPRTCFEIRFPRIYT